MYLRVSTLTKVASGDKTIFTTDLRPLPSLLSLLFPLSSCIPPSSPPSSPSPLAPCSTHSETTHYKAHSLLTTRPSLKVCVIASTNRVVHSGRLSPLLPIDFCCAYRVSLPIGLVLLLKVPLPVLD